MTNLESVLKSRDVTLLTKVCLVKAMAFPSVIYGCQSWTIKKAEHQRIDAFKLFEEELKRLDEDKRGEWKSWLETQRSKK